MGAKPDALGWPLEGELEIKRAQVAERARLLRADVRMKAGEFLAAQRNLRFTEELFQVNREALDLLRTRVSQEPRHRWKKICSESSEPAGRQPPPSRKSGGSPWPCR